MTSPIDPFTSPIDSIRDWIAKHAGYYLSQNDPWPMVIWKHAEKDSVGGHPFPPTLDAAASAMPEGWTWTREYLAPYYDQETGLRLTWRGFHDKYGSEYLLDTGDEIADRYRLAALCILAAKENA